MGDLFAGVMQTLGAAEKVIELTKRVPEFKQSGGSFQASHMTGRIELNNVSFAYPGRGLLLRGTSLTVEAGTVVALVGPSGGGKSTIIKLLQRAYLPSVGQCLGCASASWYVIV